MGCKKGCGNDANKIELIVKDLIRQMIEAGQLQEGLTDCTDKRLWRDARVLTCDLLKDAVCQMAEDGDLYFVLPERVYIDEGNHVCLMMSDGSKMCSTTAIKDTHLDGVKLDGLKIKFTLNNGNEAGEVDLADLVPVAKLNEDGSVTIKQSGKADIVIPAIKVKAAKAADGTVTITNQDGTTVTIDPVRKGDKGADGRQGVDGKSAYQSWLDQGNQGSEADFIRSLKGATGAQGPKGATGETGPQGPAGPAGTSANLPPRDLVLKNSSGKITVGYAYTTER